MRELLNKITHCFIGLWPFHRKDPWEDIRRMAEEMEEDWQREKVQIYKGAHPGANGLLNDWWTTVDDNIEAGLYGGK